MLSNHLILCHPLLLWPLIFLGIRAFSSELVLCISWPKYWRFRFSFSISPSNEYSELISFRIDWFDLLAVQGTLKSLLHHHNSKASILWCSDLFMVHLLASLPKKKPCFLYVLHSELLCTICWREGSTPQRNFKTIIMRLESYGQHGQGRETGSQTVVWLTCWEQRPFEQFWALLCFRCCVDVSVCCSSTCHVAGLLIPRVSHSLLAHQVPDILPPGFW